MGGLMPGGPIIPGCGGPPIMGGGGPEMSTHCINKISDEGGSREVTYLGPS